MNSQRLTGLLLLVNVILVYLLVVVFFQQRQPQAISQSSNINKKVVTAIPNLLQDNNFDFSEVIERPLFNEDRKPVELTEQTEPLSSKNDDLTAFMLIGTVLSTEASQALLQKNNRKIERVTLGETIDGWELKSVETDHIVLVKGEKNIQLELERKSSFKPAPNKRRTTKRRVPVRPGR